MGILAPIRAIKALAQTASRQVFNKSVAVIAAAALTAGGLTVVAAQPAQAADGYFDVTGYSVKNMAIGSGSCKRTSVQVHLTKSGVEDWSVDAEIYGPTGENHSVSWGNYGGYSVFQFCPYLDDFGKHKVEWASIEAYDYDYELITSRIDYTSKSFYVRAKSKTSISAKKSGIKKRITVSAKRYNPNRYGYSNWSAKHVKIQMKSGSRWKTVKTVNLHGGKKTVTIKKRACQIDCV